MKNPHEIPVEEKPEMRKRHREPMSEALFDDPSIAQMAEEQGSNRQRPWTKHWKRSMRKQKRESKTGEVQCGIFEESKLI